MIITLSGEYLSFPQIVNVVEMKYIKMVLVICIEKSGKYFFRMSLIRSVNLF
ncbi:hypothetical protein PEC311524_16780 [Pectobacterium carotovorum subsp. carotovorum]|nr:hypothetical protein PEC311524_16780 [Pectobacterium carotovorum subsp. carotovorum]